MGESSYDKTAGIVIEGKLQEAEIRLAKIGIKVVTTLDEWFNIGVNNGLRRFGNTTKQVNYAIEKLFHGYAVICLDHYMSGRDKIANERLVELIVQRLHREHGVSPKDYRQAHKIKLTDYFHVIYDRQNLLLYLK